MRLVGVRVADRGHHAHFLFPVQRREAGGGWMPVQPVVLGEHGAARERELRPQLLVERIALRREHGERVGAAFEEDGDKHRLSGRGRSGSNPLVERAQVEPRGAVHGEHRARAVREEAAA